MATGDNAIVPLFDPGAKITAAATAAIGAGRFVRPSANMQGGPLLDISGPTTALTGGNLMQVAQTVAGERAIGVAGWDASGAGEVLPVYNGPGIVVPMVSGAATAAGVEVQSDANGAAIPLAAGRPNGMAISAAAGGVVYVRLST
jgi:hypothetical protein